MKTQPFATVAQRMKQTVCMLLLAAAHGLFAGPAGALPTPPEVWKDYDPDKGDFKEEIVREQTKDGAYYRDSYISAYFLGEEIRVFFKYAVKAGVTDLEIKPKPGADITKVIFARLKWETAE